MIDAHTHVFPNVNGFIGDGWTQGLGHGRARIGSEIAQVTPDSGDTTGFGPAISVAHINTTGVELAVLLK